MFETSILPASPRRGIMSLGYLVEAILLGLLVLFPLIHGEALPSALTSATYIPAPVGSENSISGNAQRAPGCTCDDSQPDCSTGGSAPSGDRTACGWDSGQRALGRRARTAGRHRPGDSPSPGSGPH